MVSVVPTLPGWLLSPIITIYYLVHSPRVIRYTINAHIEVKSPDFPTLQKLKLSGAECAVLICSNVDSRLTVNSI